MREIKFYMYFFIEHAGELCIIVFFVLVINQASIVVRNIMVDAEEVLTELVTLSSTYHFCCACSNIIIYQFCLERCQNQLAGILFLKRIFFCENESVLGIILLEYQLPSNSFTVKGSGPQLTKTSGHWMGRRLSYPSN